MSEKEHTRKTVLFAAPISGREKYGEYYKQIIDIFNALGCIVLNSYEDLTKNTLSTLTKEDLKKYYLEYEQQLKDADFFVAECSVSSATIGYEIRSAISYNKPTLVLRHESEATAGPPLAGNPIKLVTSVTYNQKNLKNRVTQFIKKAEKGIFVKRLPIEFTQSQVEYVEYRQRSGGIKKSFNATVRDIIEYSREHDAEFARRLEMLQ